MIYIYIVIVIYVCAKFMYAPTKSWSQMVAGVQCLDFLQADARQLCGPLCCLLVIYLVLLVT